MAGKYLERVVSALLGFVVALLPERLKEQPPFDAYASPAMHVASGLVELLIAAALFITGMITYVSEFTATAGWSAFTHIEHPDTGHLLGIGALGFLSYLLQPTSLLLVYLFAEGIVRSLDAAFTEQMLGLGAVSLAWRALLRVREKGRKVRQQALLGPARPDEVILPESSPKGMLEIYSCTEKSWSDCQVIALGEDFFILATRSLVRRGRHHAFRYQLHPLEEREVIRGTIVTYDPTAVPASTTR